MVGVIGYEESNCVYLEKGGGSAQEMGGRTSSGTPHNSNTGSSSYTGGSALKLAV